MEAAVDAAADAVDAPVAIAGLRQSESVAHLRLQAHIGGSFALRRR